MAKILVKKLIRKPDVFYYKIDAPLISKKAKAGQFVILRIHDHGERIPISLADINPKDGTISIIVMAVGKTTLELSHLKEGDDIRDLCGPLGIPTHIESGKKVILVGGGFGVAPLYPIAKAFKAAGSTVTVVMGARSHDLLIYEKEMGEAADKVLITTDDGSRGIKGVVTDALIKEIKENGADMVMSVGPAIMMKFVSKATESFGIKTYVSLNPIMIDGSGMCGGCRVSVGGETKFACADGPDFDGHKVDWDQLMSRQRTFVNEEKISFESWKSKHPMMVSE
jgi:ferredoxin--NADP+ reductase